LEAKIEAIVLRASTGLFVESHTFEAAIAHLKRKLGSNGFERLDHLALRERGAGEDADHTINA